MCNIKQREMSLSSPYKLNTGTFKILIETTAFALSELAKTFAKTNVSYVSRTPFQTPLQSLPSTSPGCVRGHVRADKSNKRSAI